MPPHCPQQLPALCSWEKNHSSRARREGTGEYRKACTWNSGLRSCFPSLFKAGVWLRLFPSFPPATVLSCLPLSFPNSPTIGEHSHSDEIMAPPLPTKPRAHLCFLYLASSPSHRRALLLQPPPRALDYAPPCLMLPARFTAGPPGQVCDSGAYTKNADWIPLTAESSVDIVLWTRRGHCSLSVSSWD